MFNGGGNPLREQICEDILAILKNCHDPKALTETQNHYNRIFNVLENSYNFLKLYTDYIRNKCISLKTILNLRNEYSTNKNNHYPLTYCLCLKMDEQKNVELKFYHTSGYSCIILSGINPHYRENYYNNSWLPFINFIRTTINIIEIEIRERDKNANARLAQLKKEFTKEKEEENNKLFNKMRREIEEAKSASAAAEEPTSNSNNDLIAALRQTMSEQPNPLQNNTGATAGPAEANQSTNLSQIPKGMLQAIRRNVKPTQQVSNNQNPAQPPKRNGSIENNLEAIRQADKNRNNFLKRFAELNKD